MCLSMLLTTERELRNKRTEIENKKVTMDELEVHSIFSLITVSCEH